MTKVNVTSMTIGEVSVFEPSIPFRVSWPAKGSTRPIEKEILEQLMFNAGFDYMIRTGMLYIEDLEQKKELGIEPEDATEPVNIIPLTDADKKKYMSVYGVDKFKEVIKKLSIEQISDLADYAIEHEIADFEKSEIIKKALSGIYQKDIIKAIQFKRQNEEEEKSKK